MLLTNIVWAYDEDDMCHNLPTEARVNISMDPDDIADWLSDLYGCCVISFKSQPLNTAILS